MPRRSVISQMPEDQRKALDKQIIARGFGGYRDLEEWLFDEFGIELSYVSIHAYGKDLQRKLEAIKTSTNAAMAIAEAAPDDADMRSNAVISLIQTEFFNLLVNLEEANEAKDQNERMKLLALVSDGFGKLTRASVIQKQWMAEIKRKIEAADKKITEIGRKAMITPEVLQTIRREVYQLIE